MSSRPRPIHAPHGPPRFRVSRHPLNSTPSATDEFRLPDHHSRSAAVRSFAGGDGQLTPRLLGAAAHVNLPDADRAGAAVRHTVGMRVAGVSTADTHSDWGWRRRLVASRSAKPAPQHVTETLPLCHPSPPQVHRSEKALIREAPAVATGRSGRGRKAANLALDVEGGEGRSCGRRKTDLTDDAIVTAVVGRIAGKFPMLDLAQFTAQTRKALEPFGAVRICSFLSVLVDRRVVVALGPTQAAERGGVPGDGFSQGRRCLWPSGCWSGPRVGVHVVQQRLRCLYVGGEAVDLIVKHRR